MVLPYQHIHDAVHGKVPWFKSTDPENYPIGDDQIQPASFDLRLGTQVYIMWSAASATHSSVEELLRTHVKYRFEMKPGEPAFLERGDTYIIPLLEECALPKNISMICSPKSSTGRNDVFVRVLSDGGRYDQVPSAYHGRLYLEVTPLSFCVGVRPGKSLTQARLKTEQGHILGNEELIRLHTQEGIVFDAAGTPIPHDKVVFKDGNIIFHVDLDRPVVGFEAKENVMQMLNLACEDGAYDPRDFWIPVRRPQNGRYVLTPNKFCLLATKERVRIPKMCSGEMLPYEVSVMEGRTHYAGFFDNGFGADGGTSGVMEVRGREMPFLLEDGQEICAMQFEQTLELPEKTYEGHYTDPRPSLSKHFKDRVEAWTPEYWGQV